MISGTWVRVAAFGGRDSPVAERPTHRAHEITRTVQRQEADRHHGQCAEQHDKARMGVKRKHQALPVGEAR